MEVEEERLLGIPSYASSTCDDDVHFLPLWACIELGDIFFQSCLGGSLLVCDHEPHMLKPLFGVILDHQRK